MGRTHLRVAEWFASIQLLDGKHFTPWLHSRIYQLTVLSIQCAENVSDHLHLDRHEAACRGAIGAGQYFRTKVAYGRILDDTIHDPIETITLTQDLAMDQTRPSGCCDEIGRIDRASDGKEARSPRLKVVEIQGWSSSHHAVEIIGEFFCGFDGLAAAEGAT